MKKNLLFNMTLILLFFTSTDILFAGDDLKKFQKSFDTDQKIKLDLVLGGCTIVPSNDTKIHLLVEYNYDESEFEVRITERIRSINIEEKLMNNPNGFSMWTLAVPKDAEIEFNSATGSLTVEKVDIELEANSGTGSISVANCQGDYELNSGTGSIEVTESKGEFELGSGTGKVEISDSKGNFEAGSGTGRVIADHVELLDEGEFNSGTGSVKIENVTGQNFDLNASSGTGTVTLIMKKSNLKGYFEFSTNVRYGKIKSPIEFDGTEIIDSEGGHDKQVRSWFQKGKDTPRYYIKTGTGSAVLEL